MHKLLINTNIHLHKLVYYMMCCEYITTRGIVAYNYTVCIIMQIMFKNIGVYSI